MQLLHRSDCSLKQTYNKTKKKKKKEPFLFFFQKGEKSSTRCSLAVILLIEFWAHGIYCTVNSAGKWTHPHRFRVVVILQSRLLYLQLCVCVCGVWCVVCVCVFLWVLPAAKSIISQSKQSIKKHKWSSNPRGETLHQFTPCVEANQPV